MTRDLALIILAGVLVVAALASATILALESKVDPAAALGAATAAIGIAGVALGRISGANAPAPEKV